MLSGYYHHSPRWRSQNLSDCVFDLEGRFLVGIDCSPQFVVQFAEVRRHCHVLVGVEEQAAAHQVGLVDHCDQAVVDHSHLAATVAEVVDQLDQVDYQETGCLACSSGSHYVENRQEDRRVATR